MASGTLTDQHQLMEDAAVVALLRALERNGSARRILADMTPHEQAEVFAAEARHMRRD